MKISKLWFGVLLAVFLTIIFETDFLLHLADPLSNIHQDAYLQSFTLKHNLNVLLLWNWNDFSTLPMFYGFKNSLFYSDSYITQTLLAIPLCFFISDMVLLYNIFSFVSLVFSFISMYFLVLYFTKKVLPAVLGAVIFVFNPFVIGHFPDHLMLFSLQWIPLIFLFLEKIIKKPSGKNYVLFFSLLICQLFSSLYYSAFLTVVLPVYFAGRLYQEKISPYKFLSKSFIISLIFFSGVLFWLGMQYKQTLSSGLTSGRDAEFTEKNNSAWLSDFFLTNYNNLVYGGIKKKLSEAENQFINPRNTDFEQSLFPGLTVIALLIASLFLVRKTTDRKIWLMSFVLLLCSVILMFGPIIHLTKDITFPNFLYSLVYQINPFFHYLRGATRWAVFLFFFSGLIAAYTLSKLPRIKLFGVVFIVLILLEYWNKPLEYIQIDNQTKDFYRVLNKQNQIKVIADWPISLEAVDSRGREINLDAGYLMLATYLHSKKLINGYSGYTPLIYEKRAFILGQAGLTKTTLALLKTWGADAIIIHKNIFSELEDFESLKQRIIALGVPVVNSTADLIAFDLQSFF